MSVRLFSLPPVAVAKTEENVLFIPLPASAARSLAHSFLHFRYFGQIQLNPLHFPAKPHRICLSYVHSALRERQSTGLHNLHRMKEGRFAELPVYLGS